MGRKIKLAHTSLQRYRRSLFTETRTYISDVISPTDFLLKEFNLILSGCGTGKSFFVARTLPNMMRWIKPYEMLFVTSRSITVDQQSRQNGVSKYDKSDLSVVKFWNNESDDEEIMAQRGIQIMTYDKIIQILKQRNSVGHETLKRIKLIVFDECHTLFSDTFISGMDVLQVWIRDTLYLGEKYLIGMTATPGILFHHENTWGVKLNKINKSVLKGYTAKQIVCTNVETVPYLIASNHLAGKTMIMCATVDSCFKMQKEIPDSAVLISPHNPRFTPEMESIRKTIVDEETLPDTFLSVTERNEKGKAMAYERRPLNVLIVTSTAREGFNLKPESGIRNIVCCYGDPLHITQVCGRARFDIDTLVVADTYFRGDNLDQDSYLAEQRKAFKGFLYLRNNLKWFDGISHLVNHDVYGTKRFILSSDESRFISYINTKWLVPPTITKKCTDKYKIWRQEDKNEIVGVFRDCKLVSLPDDLITFHKVMSTLTRSLGYEVESGRQRFDGSFCRYKLIVSYDDEKSSYEKAVNPLDDQIGGQNSIV